MWLDHFGGLNTLVFYIFCGVAAVIVVVGLIALIAPCCLPHVNAYTPGGTVDFYIIIGGRLIALTVLLRGIDPTWTDSDILKVICEFTPAAVIIGFTLFVGGLFVKGATIYAYTWYKKPSALADEWKPNFAIWGMLIAIGIAAAVWCVLFTPHLAELSGQRYTCYSQKGDFEWKIATSVWDGLLLLLALIMVPLHCRRSRKKPCSPESTGLSIAVVNTLVCEIAGICVYFLYTTATPTVMYGIVGGLQLWMVLFADIVMLAAKITVAKREANAVPYEDERYDVIKEDAVSGL